MAQRESQVERRRCEDDGGNTWPLRMKRAREAARWGQWWGHRQWVKPAPSRTGWDTSLACDQRRLPPCPSVHSFISSVCE